MKIEIKHWSSENILVCGEYESIKECLEKSAAAKKDLQGAYLRGAYLQGADLRGADLRGAYLQGAYLRGAYLQGADLQGADLQGAYLWGADLQGADLQGAYLQCADLWGAHLQGAYLWGAHLQGAYLQGGADGEKIPLVGNRPGIQSGPIGSRSDYLVGYVTEKGLMVQAGCFFGTDKEFLAKVKETHDGNKHAKEYEAAIAFIREHPKLWK